VPRVRLVIRRRLQGDNVPLEFDPNAPPVPPPVLTIAPSTALRGGTSDLQFERSNVPLVFAPDPVPPATGLPATGAPSRRMARFGAGMCLLGALVLALARRRARPVIEWHSEVDTLA
jgi:hypothetical protein